MTTPSKLAKIDGFLLLDKPKLLSSNQALQQVKSLLRIKKAGHTGSLDPMATGMLPICFGEGTKYSRFLLDADKEYDVIAKLGEISTTGDLEGEITAQGDIAHINIGMIEQKLKLFLGKTQQMPTMYSAIKYQGQPLYQYARQGIEVPRPVRDITIHRLEFLSYESGLLSLRVHCSKGTYIRTLIEDIGNSLGCGAYVVELRRLSVGVLQQTQMINLQDVINLTGLEERRQLVLPIENLFPHWPIMSLSTDESFYIRRGQIIHKPDEEHLGYVRMLENNTFIGVGELLADGRLAPRRLMQTD